MTAAEILAPRISERLTWAEIRARYPNEWVCLVEMTFSPPRDAIPRFARVVSHARTNDEAMEQAKRWRTKYRTIGQFYTGAVIRHPRWPRVIVDDELRDYLQTLPPIEGSVHGET